MLLKFNPLDSLIRDRRVILVDDSIVRSTTARRLVSILRRAGAREVHLRITCPPITHPCFMGVDMPTQDELAAHRHSPDGIRKLLNADSLHFLTLDGMMEAINSSSGYCNACFTGRYPFDVAECAGLPD